MARSLLTRCASWFLLAHAAGLAACDAPSTDTAASAATDFVPGGAPLPIVIAASRWNDGPEVVGKLSEIYPGIHVSLHAQAELLADYLDAAAGLTDGFTVQCAGATCPEGTAHPAGEPAIWFGAAADFADDPVVVAAFPDPTAAVPVRGRQRYVLRPAGDSYYVIGATDRATDPAMWALLGALGYRHFAPGPAWEVLPRLASPAIVDVDRDETPAFLFHGFLMQPDPQSGAGQEDWLRHNRMGDDSLRRMQGQWISGSWYQTGTATLSDVIRGDLHAWREELSRTWSGTQACHAACMMTEGATDSLCAEGTSSVPGCLATAVPAATVCPAPDLLGVTMASSDPATEAAIVDYFTALATSFFRAYPEADVFSFETTDQTVACCDGAACAAPSDAYFALANTIAAHLRTCPVGECPWNDPTDPQPKFVAATTYNQTSTPPTIALDPNVIAFANQQTAASTLPVLGALAAPEGVVGIYGYAFTDHDRKVDNHPVNAEAYLAQWARLDASLAPRRIEWAFVESYRGALVRPVQWQATFQHAWGAPATAAQAAALTDDFFTAAFPEPTSRARIRRFYDDVRLLDHTPSDDVLGRCHWHVSEARALAEANCTPAVCGAPGEPRYQRMLDRFDSLTLYLRVQELAYHRLDARPAGGAFEWYYAQRPDPAAEYELGALLMRAAAPIGAQGAALLDTGAHADAIARYCSAPDACGCNESCPACAPISGAELAAMDVAGRALHTPAVTQVCHLGDGVPTVPAFSDDLVAPPPGLAVACADGADCGSFALAPAQAARSTELFDYHVVLGDTPQLPEIVGTGETSGYFVQVRSAVTGGWTDLFGGRPLQRTAGGCGVPELSADEAVELAGLAGRQLRLRALFENSSKERSAAVCEDEVWGEAAPRRAVRGPVSWTVDGDDDYQPTTVHHFLVPPGLATLDAYGLEAACLVAPSGETYGVTSVRDGKCHMEPGWPCTCTADAEPVVDATHRFLPGRFLRETAIPLHDQVTPIAQPAGIWRIYKTAGVARQDDARTTVDEIRAMPFTLRNAPPYFAARPELLPVPRECVTSDGTALVPACGR